MSILDKTIIGIELDFGAFCLTASLSAFFHLSGAHVERGEQLILAVDRIGICTTAAGTRIALYCASLQIHPTMMYSFIGAIAAESLFGYIFSSRPVKSTAKTAHT